MATRTRKNVVTETTKESLLKEGFVEMQEEVLQEIEKIEPVIELVEEPVKLEIPKSTPIRWKKIGNGSFILNNRYIKPGQTFMATVEEIPTAFRDVVVPMENLPADKLIVYPETKYTLTKVEESGMYNITDINGKILNEGELSLDAAERLLKAL